MISNIIKIGPSKIGNTYEYNTKDKLGSGAFASVYKGIHSVTKEEHAIKVINKDEKMKRDPQLMKFIFDEINIQLQLRNKNIVDLLDYIETDRHIYIIQEFCNGGTLDSVLKERHIMPEEEAIIIFKDLLVGCEQLSQKNVAHRDLKPENILIADGNYKLADFGFADKIEKTTFSNVGTPLYMSPQQLNNQKTTKSDIWSLGVIFYQMLYGYQTTPWGHLTDFKSTEDFKRKMINSPSLYFPPSIATSKAAKDFIFMCLQKDENRRISWDQIFKHPLFNQQEQQYNQNQSQVQQQVKQIPQQQQQQQFIPQQQHFSQIRNQPQQQQQHFGYNNNQQGVYQQNNQYPQQYPQQQYQQQIIYPQNQNNMPQPPQQQYQPQPQQQYNIQQPPQPQFQQQNQQNNQGNPFNQNIPNNQGQKNIQNKNLDDDGFQQFIGSCAYCEQPFQDEQQKRQHKCELQQQFEAVQISNK